MILETISHLLIIFLMYNSVTLYKYSNKIKRWKQFSTIFIERKSSTRLFRLYAYKEHTRYYAGHVLHPDNSNFICQGSNNHNFNVIIIRHAFVCSQQNAFSAPISSYYASGCCSVNSMVGILSFLTRYDNIIFKFCNSAFFGESGKISQRCIYNYNRRIILRC